MWFPGLEGCIGMVSWLGKDEQDFGDFGCLGKSLVVISMISVIRGRFCDFGHFCDFGDFNDFCVFLVI